MKKMKFKLDLVVIGAILWIVFIVSLAMAAIYTAFHFIAKYW